MSTEDNYENVTLPVKSVDITSSTTFGETQYPNLSTTNATRSPSLNQYLNGLNAVESEVYLRIFKIDFLNGRSVLNEVVNICTTCSSKIYFRYQLNICYTYYN